MPDLKLEEVSRLHNCQDEAKQFVRNADRPSHVGHWVLGARRELESPNEEEWRLTCICSTIDGGVGVSDSNKGTYSLTPE